MNDKTIQPRTIVESPCCWTRTRAQTLDTTDTQDSFATVPEIMKEFEHLVDTVLDQRKPEVTINTMVNEGKKPEGGQEDKIPIDEPEWKGELKLNHPKPFTRKREELKKFL